MASGPRGPKYVRFTFDSAQPQEGKNEHDDDDQAYEVDNAIHGNVPFFGCSTKERQSLSMVPLWQ
jgi:hypothetical protein